MTWPTALTTDDDLTRYGWEQGHGRLVESGESTTALHEGAADVVGNWLEANGVPSRDDVVNTSAFRAAAANLVMSWLLRETDPTAATDYRLEHLRLLKHTRPQLAGDEARSGGQPARIVMLKQGDATHYTGRQTSRTAGLFPRGRNDGNA